MWTLDSTRIFVQEYGGKGTQIIARLNPINSETIHHLFGWETETFDISAIVVSSGDKNSLVSMTTDGIEHLLTTPYSTSEYLYVKSVKWKQMASSCQTIRTDLPSDSPVYTVDIELYEDKS